MHDPDKCDLTTPFELYGAWWREGRDFDKRVSGCLSYTPDHGLQLQLYDDLPGETLESLIGPGSTRPIWGEVYGWAGKRVKASLLGVIETNRPNDPDAPEKPSAHTIFLVNRAIFGVHVVDANSLHLTSMHFSVSDLESFADTMPVAPSIGSVGVKVDYMPAERPEETLQWQDVRVRIKTLVESNASRFGRNCTVTWRDEMVLKPAKPLRFDESTELVFSLTNFFRVCARDAVELRYVRGVLASGGAVSAFGAMRRRKTRTTARDWVLTLKDLGSLGDVLDRWFALVKKLRFVGPVFFSELTSPSPLQDARFFHFAGCLEAFHREVVQSEVGKFITRKEYREATKSLLAHLPGTLPAALKDAMRSALSFANDHSFAERIDALFNSLEPATQRQLTDDPQRFLAAIKRSRNKLAHVTDDAPGETFEGREFAHANIAIRAWLTILMLKECGISESLIAERMRAVQYFPWGPFVFKPRS